MATFQLVLKPLKSFSKDPAENFSMPLRKSPPNCDQEEVLCFEQTRTIAKSAISVRKTDKNRENSSKCKKKFFGGKK